MKKLISSLLCLLACTLSAAEAQNSEEFIMPVTAPKAPSASSQRALKLNIEIAENDFKDYGLQQLALYNEIATRLALGQISIKSDAKLPELTLRLKTIPVDSATASFIQLAYYEPATLARNNTPVMALTWSQATMLSCAREDLAKEVSQVLVGMINSFVLDYQKAMAPL